jgi:hypothetical protein
MKGVAMRSVLVLSLALVPPLIAAAWTLLQLRRAERAITSGMTGFEGMHLED